MISSQTNMVVLLVIKLGIPSNPETKGQFMHWISLESPQKKKTWMKKFTFMAVITVYIFKVYISIGNLKARQ